VGDRPAAEVYQGLREILLTRPPAELGIEPREPLTSVWGALVEIGFAAGASATVVSLADGTTSMYTSTGGGVIGAGQHEGPAAASRRFLAALQAELDLLPPADACPLPPAERVAFVVLTYDGIRRMETTRLRLADPNDAGHGLWMAANEVVTEIRRLSQPPT
jgi:hypothetical protein